jgi:glycosyltransferase involved in cell wall biosynthesis
METPLVSISLVAFNAENYLRDAIEGCLKQEVSFPYEIIIHDDASCDSSPQIIREYAANHPQMIIPIIQQENQYSQGVEIIAKYIVPKAKGKYIAFVEADDYWIDPEKLQNQIDFLESHQDFSMCFTATKHIFSQPSKKPRLIKYRNYDCVCPPKDVILRGGSLLDMISAVARRSVFDDIPEWYFYRHLWDVSIPLLSLLHGKIQYQNNVTSVYRENLPGSWTNNTAKNYEKRKNNINNSIRISDGFDKESNYKYHHHVTKKINSLIVGFLLLSSQDEENYNRYYERLPFFKKLEYRVFKLLGSFQLWDKYRQISRYFSINFCRFLNIK